MNKLDNLSTADWTVDFDIGIQCWYIDESHVGHAEGEVGESCLYGMAHLTVLQPEKDVFKPDFEFCGAIDVTPVICVEDGGSFNIRESYRQWGIIKWYQRYRGTVEQELSLHSFPLTRRK